MLLCAVGAFTGCGETSAGSGASTASSETQVSNDSVSTERRAERRRDRARERARRARARRRRARLERERAERQAEDEGEAAQEPQTTTQSESNCDSSYEGACLDRNASDYDCEGGSGDGPKYVAGPIQVVGDDHFDLDRDGDGVGCES
jgi:hypothetical protein